MGTMIARLKVKDYDSWRPAFDSAQSGRAASGLSDERVYRSAEDGNEIVLVMSVSDMKKAKEFAASSTRKEAMERAGVVGTPTDYFIE